MGVISNGTTLIDNGALDPAVPSGSLILLSTQTASASANISFTSGIDSTYDFYVFEYISIHPATDGADLEFNMSTDGGSNYNVTKTTTFVRVQHNEADFDTGLLYMTSLDLAQSTSFQKLTEDTGNNNDQSLSGSISIFNPSSTTYVKHFISNSQGSKDADYSIQSLVAGYGNTTSAVNAIRFQMSTGNIDAGTIKMYGVK